MVFLSNVDVCDCLLRVVHVHMPTMWYHRAWNGQCTAIGEPENAMKRRNALVSKEELLGTKSAKWVRKLLKHMSRFCTGKNRTKHVISINTYHLACAKGSALQCCSFVSWSANIAICTFTEQACKFVCLLDSMAYTCNGHHMNFCILFLKWFSCCQKFLDWLSVIFWYEKCIM